MLKYQVLVSQRTPYIRRLHSQCVPIVQIAVREVDAADLASFHTVHGVGTTFHKSVWYQGNSPMIRSENAASIFKPQGNKRHQMLRKIDAHLHTASAVTVWEDLVTSKGRLAVLKIHRDASTSYQ